MEIYKGTNPELEDCDPTVAFVTRVSNLILAMTSRNSLTGLTNDNSSFEVVC